MGGQVYDRESIEKMYGKGGEDFPGETIALGSPHDAYEQALPMQCRTHLHAAAILPLGYRHVAARMPAWLLYLSPFPWRGCHGASVVSATIVWGCAS